MNAFPSRAAIVATARESIGRGSQSFAAASRLFDPRTREHAWLLYAWCRRCDDLADGQQDGHGGAMVADAAERLEAIRVRTQAALDGQWVGDSAFDALRIVVEEAGIPARFVCDVVDGFALDAAGWRPASEADLMRYCYHVAGAVGCMMAVIMGVPAADEATLDRACDLGIAFQLANIARDLAEDEANGRCYLPQDWLNEAADRAALARRLCDRAELYAASARSGAARLSFRSAWAVLAAADIYGAIAKRVGTLGGHAWDGRVKTSSLEKLSFIARAWSQAANRRRLPDVPREALWTRPRGD